MLREIHFLIILTECYFIIMFNVCRRLVHIINELPHAQQSMHALMITYS